VFLALPQDIQAMAFDYPASLFEPVVHQLNRPRASVDQIAAASAALRGAKRPLIIAGGGVHYSLAEAELDAFARTHGIPVAETVAGKGSVNHDHPSYVGTIGVTGSESANRLAAEADVVLAIGTRLQDFTTGSWTLFGSATQLLGINVNRFDANKHRSVPVVGDARESLVELSTAIGSYRAEPAWISTGEQEVAGFRNYINSIGDPAALTPSGLPSYAQVVAAVAAQAVPGDFALAAAGGFPGELNNGWQSLAPATLDCEYGFSCMGYEISGGWGAAIARRELGADGEVFVFVGDGSYLMMNSDIYSSVLSGHKMVVIVCDNGGFAVINRLQVNQGGNSFNNFIADTNTVQPFAVDFAAHAASMGAHTERVQTIPELAAAIATSRTIDRTVVIVMQTDPNTWTEGGSFWEVGVPEVSPRAEVNAAFEQMQLGKLSQRLDR
jgi:3D-(3,5/4)-trihydroxycyclohexane-1,2-dione acylhydrolase (decyclizing)